MTDTTTEPTIDSVLDAAMNAGEKTVTLPTALLLKLYQDAAEGVLLAEGVITNWSGGDLAGAVNALEEWVEGMGGEYADMSSEGAEDDEGDEPTHVSETVGADTSC